MQVALPPRGLLTEGEPDDEVFFVVALVEESYRDEYQQLLWAEDQLAGIVYGDYDYPTINNITSDDVQERWEALLPGLVRFDGGAPYVQFSVKRTDPNITPNMTGNLTLKGIPAGKRYFYYMAAHEDPVHTLEDLAQPAEAFLGIRYYNVAYFHSSTIGPPDGLVAVGTWVVWGDLNGVSLDATDDEIRDQPMPFSVEAGEVTRLDLRMIDR